MGKRITVESITKQTFYQIPKVLLHSPKYDGMSALSILAYGILKDRAALSHKNHWYQENKQGENEIYFIFTNDELMKVLGIKSKSTISKVKKELEEFKLLEQERQGMNKPNKLFLCEIDSSIEDFQTLTSETYPQAVPLDNKGSTENGHPKSVLLEVQKLYGNYTEDSKTDKNLDTKDTQETFKSKNDYMQEAFYKNKDKVPSEIAEMLKAFYGIGTTESEKYYQIILKAKSKLEKELNTVIWLENDPEATQIIIDAFSLAIRKIERERNIYNPDGYAFTAIYNALFSYYQTYYFKAHEYSTLFN